MRAILARYSEGQPAADEMDPDEPTYLTNACGEDTGNSATPLTDSDYAKLPVERGPGYVLTYLVEIAGERCVLGNLEVVYKHSWWSGDDADYRSESEVRAYCEAACDNIRSRLTEGAKLLPIYDDQCGRMIISVAIPLNQMSSEEDTLETLTRVFGSHADLADLASADSAEQADLAPGM